MILDRSVIYYIFWHDQWLCTWQDLKVIYCYIYKYDISQPQCVQFEHFKLWRLYHSTCIIINDHSTHWQCYINIFQGLAVSFALFVFCMDTDFSTLVYQTGLFFFFYFINSLNELIGQFYIHLTSTSSGVATL